MILADTSLGDGPPVVILHGLLGQARNFGAIQRRLAPTNRVIALDLRNHGHSPHAPGMAYPLMADDVLETLTALNARPCALIGHSMGGKVAMATALTHPEAVSRLLVADIAPVPSPPRFAAILAAMQALPLPPDLTRATADATLAHDIPDPGMRAFLLQNLSFTGPAPAWKPNLPHLIAGLPDILDWPPFTTHYPGPTLFLAGATSDYILPEHRPIIRPLFPTARFATLKSAGHWLHADNPEGFLAVLQSFLGA